MLMCVKEEIFRLIIAKGGNCDLQDTNGCSAAHIMVVYDNIKMFDMAVECGAAINMTNRLGLTPLTMAAYLARMDMFFHIASIERDIYWQLGNITCSAYPLRKILGSSCIVTSVPVLRVFEFDIKILYNIVHIIHELTAYCDRYLDTIDSDTGELNPISALNLIVFGPKLEHLDLIEYVVVDLLKVKWNTFIKREFFKQMAMFTVFFSLAITAFIIRPLVPEEECDQEEEETSSGNLTMSPLTTDMEEPPMAALLLSNATNATCEMVARQVSDGQSVSIHEVILIFRTHFTNCYLHSIEEPMDQIRFACEVLIVFFGFLYILKALRELSFLGIKIFMENMQLCPSRVCFLVSCVLLQVTVLSTL